MSTEIQKKGNGRDLELLKQVYITTGDLTGFTPNELMAIHDFECKRMHFDPLSRPFDLLELNGKKVWYYNKNGAAQARARDEISVQIKSAVLVDDIYVVTAVVTNTKGRSVESTGAVPLVIEEKIWDSEKPNGKDSNGEWRKRGGYKTTGWIKASPVERANLMAKAETKAIRRATLSMLGTGMLDESEVESIPGARTSKLDDVTPVTRGTPHIEEAKTYDTSASNTHIYTLKAFADKDVMMEFEAEQLLEFCTLEIEKIEDTVRYYAYLDLLKRNTETMEAFALDYPMMTASIRNLRKEKAKELGVE